MKKLNLNLATLLFTLMATSTLQASEDVSNESNNTSSNIIETVKEAIGINESRDAFVGTWVEVTKGSKKPYIVEIKEHDGFENGLKMYLKSFKTWEYLKIKNNKLISSSPQGVVHEQDTGTFQLNNDGTLQNLNSQRIYKKQ